MLITVAEFAMCWPGVVLSVGACALAFALMADNRRPRP